MIATATAGSVRARILRLPGKLVMRITPVSPTVGTQLFELVGRAELYILIGVVTSSVRGVPAVGLGAYVGQSAAHLTTRSRVRVSYQRWVETLSVLSPTAVVTITRRGSRPPLTEPFRLFLEGAAIQYLRSHQYWLVNIRSAAPRAAQELTRREVLLGARIAQRTSALIARHGFHGAISPVVSSTQREELMAIVQAADRALDGREVLIRARALGLPLSGSTPHQTIRRDLAQRCRQERLPAKVHAAWVGGRRVYFNPHLRQDVALQRYTEAQTAAGRSLPTGRPPVRRDCATPRRNSAQCPTGRPPVRRDCATPRRNSAQCPTGRPTGSNVAS